MTFMKYLITCLSGLPARGRQLRHFFPDPWQPLTRRCSANSIRCSSKRERERETHPQHRYITHCLTLVKKGLPVRLVKRYLFQMACRRYGYYQWSWFFGSTRIQKDKLLSSLINSVSHHQRWQRRRFYPAVKRREETEEEFCPLFSHSSLFHLKMERVHQRSTGNYLYYT